MANVPDRSKRRFLLTLGGFTGAFVTGCLDTPEFEQGGDDDDTDGGRSLEDDPVVTVPRYIELGVAALNPVYDGDSSERRLRLTDYHSMMHSVGAVGSMMVGEEMSHEDYRYELPVEYGESMDQEFMAEAGDLVTVLVSDVEEFFSDGGSVSPYIRSEILERDTEEIEDETEADREAVREQGEWGRHGEPRLEDYAELTNLYGLYYEAEESWGSLAEKYRDRGDDDWVRRYESLSTSLKSSLEGYISETSRYVVQERYENGGFLSPEGELTHDSMVHGIGAVSGIYYDQLYDNRLTGYSDGEVLETASETSDKLDDYWDEEVSAYDFGEGPEYRISEVGAVLQWHVGVSEFLHAEGRDESARTVSDRGAEMLDTLLSADIAEPWGLPDAVEFTHDGAEAASGTVSAAENWTFVGRLSGLGGFAEDTETLVAELHPETWERRREFIDDRLREGVDNQECFDEEGLVISEFDYETGEVTEGNYSAEGVGSLLNGVVSAYRMSDLYAPASEWEDADTETVERSEKLYDTVLLNYGFLREQFLRGRVRRSML